MPYDKVFRVIIYKIYHEEARNSKYKLLALNGFEMLVTKKLTSF